MNEGNPNCSINLSGKFSALETLWKLNMIKQSLKNKSADFYPLPLDFADKSENFPTPLPFIPTPSLYYAL